MLAVGRIGEHRDVDLHGRGVVVDGLPPERGVQPPDRRLLQPPAAWRQRAEPLERCIDDVVDQQYRVWIAHRYSADFNLLAVDIKLVNILFFVSPEWAMFWAVFVSIWAHMGFYTLILLAGLQAIQPDLYEAAEMDGTSKERVFFRITLPLLWPNMLVVIVLALIKGVQVFDEVYVLTGGGPGTATQFIVQYIYNTAFTNQVQCYIDQYDGYVVDELVGDLGDDAHVRDK